MGTAITGWEAAVPWSRDIVVWRSMLGLRHLFYFISRLSFISRETDFGKTKRSVIHVDSDESEEEEANTHSRWAFTHDPLDI